MPGNFLRLIFCALAMIAVSSSYGADAKRFELVKGIHYYQIGSGVAHLQTNNTYRFNVEVSANVIGNVLGASVITPKSQRIDLLADNDGDPFRFRDRFDPEDRFAFENFFPSGTYQLLIRTRNDGDRTMTFAITGDAYPSAPVLNDYNGAQNLPYNQYNEISWQPFAGGTATDFIQVQIEDIEGRNVWETPDFSEEGALSGVDTRTIIPPGTLRPGVVYFGTIRFVRALHGGSRQYSGVPGPVGYFSRTEFTMRAVSTGLQPVVDRLQIWRKSRFDQLPDGRLLPDTQQWQFEARVDTVSSNQLRQVNVRAPGSQTNLFEIQPDGTEFEDSRSIETTQASFLQLYPSGPYTFEFVRPDSSVTRTVIDLPAGSFPPPPNIHGVPTFQNRKAGQPLVVSWDPWTTGADPDFIRVELTDDGRKVWDTSNYSSPKHLRPNISSVIIPGELFVPGHDYELEVHFYDVTVSGTRIIPGGLVFGGFESRTKVEFSTEKPDAATFSVAEGQYLWQRGTDASHIEPDPAGAFRFEAQASAARTNSLLGAQVTTPTGRAIPLTRNSDGLDFEFRAIEPSAAALAQNYPAGTYQFVFNTANEGARTSSVRLPSTQLPPIPRVRNFNTLTSIASDSPYDVTWDPWVDVNVTTDRVRFTIETLSGAIEYDSDGATGDEISPLTNRVTIKKDLLRTRTVYIGRLRFERASRFESATYPGAKGEAAVFSEVAFYLGTLTFRVGRPALINDQVQFQIAGLLVGRTYALSSTTDFRTWTRVKTVTISTATAATQLYATSPVGDRAFYRWELLP